MKVSSFLIKLIILLSSILMFSGCVSSLLHAVGEEMKPYEGACYVWNDAVCVWWNKSDSFHKGISQFYIKMSYPFWVVDCPCEAIVDTICLPFDIWNVKP